MTISLLRPTSLLKHVSRDRKGPRYGTSSPKVWLEGSDDMFNCTEADGE
jgi:hypothetical protein